MTDSNIFIEQQIIEAVRNMLTGRVNELLGDMKINIPLIEFYDYRGGTAVVPVISLFTCERIEKERVIKLDAYSLTITLTVPEMPESEMYCYAYAASVCNAMGEDYTLGGVVDRAVVSGKKYTPPKKAGCGNEWELIISMRVTVEGIGK